MLVSFRCKETEKIWNRDFSRKLPHDIQRIAYRKLLMLHAAISIKDLEIPPSNHLEKLKGARVNHFSIRVNDQYRICFIWADTGVIDIELVDYH